MNIVFLASWYMLNASSKSVRCVVVFGASFFLAMFDAY